MLGSGFDSQVQAQSQVSFVVPCWLHEHLRCSETWAQRSLPCSGSKRGLPSWSCSGGRCLFQEPLVLGWPERGLFSGFLRVSGSCRPQVLQELLWLSLKSSEVLISLHQGSHSCPVNTLA